MSKEYLEHLKQELNELKKKYYICSLPKDSSLISMCKAQIQELKHHISQIKDE